MVSEAKMYLVRHVKACYKVIGTGRYATDPTFVQGETPGSSLLCEAGELFHDQLKGSQRSQMAFSTAQDT